MDERSETRAAHAPTADGITITPEQQWTLTVLIRHPHPRSYLTDPFPRDPLLCVAA